MTSRYKAWIAALMLGLPAYGLAQTGGPAAVPPASVTKVIKIKYADTNRVGSLLEGQVAFRSDNTLKVIVVRGLPDQVAAAEAIIKQVDVESVPPEQSAAKSKNIEVTAYILFASKGEIGETKRVAEIEPVIKQLQTVFTYHTYGVIDSFLLRSNVDSFGSTDGLLSWPDLPKVVNGGHYSIDYEASLDSTDQKRVILSKLKFRAYRPVAIDKEKEQVLRSEWLTMTCSVDVREGVKVVVGKSNIDSDGAYFLVLSARVVD